MTATCPKCKLVIHGISTDPRHFVPGTKCSNPRCGHLFQVELPQQMMTCGCCGGSGHYDPLTGPREPCGTCKGEKVVAVPSDKVPNLFPHQVAVVEQVVGRQRMAALEYINSAATPDERHLRKMVSFGTMYGATPDQVQNMVRENTARKELTPEERGRLEGMSYATGLTFGELYGDYIRRQDFNFAQFYSNYPFAKSARAMTPEEYMKARQQLSEDRVHRVGNHSGDIQLKFSIPQGTPEFQASCKRVEALFKKLTAQIINMGGKIEAGQASLGSFRAALDPGHPSFDAYIFDGDDPNEDEDDEEDDFDEDSDEFDDDDDSDFDDDSDDDIDIKAAIDGGAVKRIADESSPLQRSPQWASLRERLLTEYAERDAADALRMSQVAAGLLTDRQVRFYHQAPRQMGKTAGLKDMLRAMGVTPTGPGPTEVNLDMRYRIIDFHDNADFANVERVIAEKAAIMSPGTPLYYDPETGAIVRKP